MLRSTQRRRKPAFTLVEVMMAAVILTAVFVGLIEAVTLTSNTMDHARRQTLATQILSHHLEKLRTLPWDVTTAAPNELSILDLPTASTSIAIDRQFWPPWNSNTSYVANNVIYYGGAWYRCIAANTNQAPPNATYWTSVTAGATTDIVNTLGATFTLTRTLTSPDPVTNIREVNFTVSWVVKTSRRDSGGSQLTFTYSRSNSAWYGKYGLYLSHQRT